jgi:hypothetical protein
LDLRRLPLEARRERLADLLADAGPALRISEHLDGDGAVIFEHACRLGLEGVIAKRKGSAYRSGRCGSWLKVKTHICPPLMCNECRSGAASHAPHNGTVPLSPPARNQASDRGLTPLAQSNVRIMGRLRHCPGGAFSCAVFPR